MSIRIAIVEDNEEIRKLTVSLLNLYPDLECISAFSNAEDFVKALPGLLLDVVLMDIGLPGQSGIECVQACHVAYPDIEFVMFTEHTDSQEVFQAIAAGADGYVLKGGTPERLAQDIRDVKNGGSPMSSLISRMVIKSLQELSPRHPDLEKLTEQETKVLDALDKGLSYKAIADKYFVSIHTIRSQVRSIYRKLQVHTRTEALRKRNGKQNSEGE